MPWIVSVASRAMIFPMRLVSVALALVLAVVLSLGLSLGAPGVRAQAPRVYEPEQSRPWAVYFSPGGGAAQAVVEAIGRAGHTVLVQAASLSSPQITKSLADAQRRGYTDPLVESERDTWAPSGIAWLGDSLWVAALRGERLLQLTLDADLKLVNVRSILRRVHGRLRDVVVGPDGALYVTTSNRDGRGTPREGDDRILRVQP